MSLSDHFTRWPRQAPEVATPDIRVRPARGRHRAADAPRADFLAVHLIATRKGHAR